MTRIVSSLSILLLSALVGIGAGVSEVRAMPSGVVNLTTDPDAVVEGIYVDDNFMVFESVWSPTDAGVFTIFESAPGVNDVSHIPITHPTLGAPLSLTAPMKGPDGDIYVGATFLNFGFTQDTALFNLASPDTPVVEWSNNNTQISALDSNLNGYGAASGASAVRLNFDGSISALPFPSTFSGGIALDVSASGVASGQNARAGSGVAPAIWTGSNISFLDDVLDGRVWSVRDNLDGGLNLGAVLDGQAYVHFADFDLQALVDENGSALLADEVFVSETNFSVINTLDGTYAYYPGLTEIMGQALPIGDVLSDFAGLDVERVGRPFSDSVNLYIPAQGSALLVVTPDVSRVPEPASSTLSIPLLLYLAGSTRRRNVSCNLSRPACYAGRPC